MVGYAAKVREIDAALDAFPFICLSGEEKIIRILQQKKIL
jgi:hypothetical protein